MKSAPRMSLLTDRGVISVTGEDAAKLIQGLITNDLGLVDQRHAIFAALLSPQGKILADFFLSKTEGGYHLEAARAITGDLVKRLQLYKLRAKAEIKDLSNDLAVLATWGADADPATADGYTDPRHGALGQRKIKAAGQAISTGGGLTSLDLSARVYHEHRIGLGVPEGGKDFAYGEAFPHEAMMDQLNGLSFSKGCYVGQEIVSRMEHRGTARKRIVPVVAETALPSQGTEISAANVTIGTLGSTAGNRGLALIRLDRAEEFQAKGEPLMAGHVVIRIELPDWAKIDLAKSPQT